MSAYQDQPACGDSQSVSRTKIHFDLQDLLSPEEIAAFEAEAIKAGAETLTEHFLNITLINSPRAA